MELFQSDFNISNYYMSPLTFNENQAEFIVENQLKDYIKELSVPKSHEEALTQFQELYQQVSIYDWLDSELVFDIGNYIMHYRPDLVSLGIRINVQVNLFLRSIEKYAEDPDAIFETIGHSVGCFALTEEDAGVLSGLIVDTTWEENSETGGYLLNTPENSKKNWISQGMSSSYGIVYARHKDDKSDIRIFLVDFLIDEVITTAISNLPINSTLDMAKIKFDNLQLPKESCLEHSKKSTKLELLNGIFFGRYMIAEATISAMLGQIEHIQTGLNSNEKTKLKFEKLGFLDYLNRCFDEFSTYKNHLYLKRKNILYDTQDSDLTLINCYKIYTVEKSIEIFNKLQLMFGMRAATSPLRFENLLLHKVAEGDTYVLRISLINSIFKQGWFHVFTNPGFTLKDIFRIYQMETKREKMNYIMENFKDISDNIVESKVPLLNC